MALDTRSDADNASNATVLDKTRNVIKGAVRCEVGVYLATNIANVVQLQHNKACAHNNPRDSATPSRGTTTREGDAKASSTHGPAPQSSVPRRHERRKQQSDSTRLRKHAAIDAALTEEK